MNYVEMQLKPSGEIVKVYDITDGQATIWSDLQFQQCNGGWVKIKVNRLVPPGYPLNNKEYVSKTQKNKAKSRMHLEDATWKTTDGELWKHENIDDAIAHELELMEKEKNETNKEM
jgi:hypothetical protein